MLETGILKTKLCQAHISPFVFSIDINFQRMFGSQQKWVESRDFPCAPSRTQAMTPFEARENLSYSLCLSSASEVSKLFHTSQSSRLLTFSI